MSYRNSFSSPWSGGRASPYTTASLRQDDRSISDLYEYVDAGDVDSRGGGRAPAHRNSTAHYPVPAEDHNAPDVVHVRHITQLFQLHFPPFSISESAVTTGDLRQEVARHLGEDHRRVRLVYKDRDMRRDHHPIKYYGCKQNSEIVVVVTEYPYERSENHSSEEEVTYGTTITPAQTHDRRRPRGNSTVRYRVEEVVDRPEPSNFLHPNGYSTQQQRSQSQTQMQRTRSHSPAPQPSTSRPPAPAPTRSPPRPAADPNSPMGKVQALEALFNDKWLPESERFLASPPYDAREREKEQKRLGECVMRYIIEAADAIELQGDQEARQERKKVLNQANELVKRLDHMGR